MVKRDGLNGRCYLEEDERLHTAPPGLKKRYPNAQYILRRVPTDKEKRKKEAKG